MMPQRITYVIDERGLIQLVYSSHLNMKAHAQKALAVVRSGR